MILELFLFGVIAVVTWCVASDGAWGAAFTLLSVIIAGLLATSLFEVTATFLEQNIAGSYAWQYRWDIIALVGLFSAIVFAIRAGTEYIMPVDIEIHGMIFDVARWTCGLLTGWVTMAFLLTALHTAPLPREFLGFTPEPSRRAGPIGRSAPDLKWLGYVHYMTETAFRKGADGPVFDGPRFEMYSGGPEVVRPSFPIRYASRRDQYFGAAAAPSAAPASAAPDRSRSGSGRRSTRPRF